MKTPLFARARTRCPAKINLKLTVFPPDESGLHPLSTIFQSIDLCDELEIAVGSESFQVEGATLPEENTVTKTLRFIRDVADLPPLSIHLTKRIPSEAGLGGASSNAAGVIRLIMAMFPGELQRHQAQDIASAVGADVPFFLLGGRAEGAHYGDQCVPLQDLPIQSLALVKPKIGKATPAAYKDLDAIRNDPIRFQNAKANLNDDYLENDFLLVASKESLQLMEMMHISGLSPVGMSGSGSSIFGFASSKDIACRFCASIPESDLEIEFSGAVQTLTRANSIEVHTIM